MKKLPIILFGLFILTISLAAADTICNGSNTPILIVNSLLELNQDQQFIYNVTIANNIAAQIIFSWVPINVSIPTLNIGRETGTIKATPTIENIGSHSIFIIATTPDGCYDMEKISLLVHEKPSIEDYSPANNLQVINETGSIKFSVNAKDKDNSGLLSFEWYHNNRKMQNTGPEYILTTNYSDAGKHSVRATISDPRGLKNSIDWIVNVINKDRPPYLKARMPSLVISEDQTGELFNLNNYIDDLDKDSISFQAFFVDIEAPELLLNKSDLFDISINDKGALFLKVKSQIYIKQYVRVKATDTFGQSVLVEPISIRIATQKDKAAQFFTQTPSMKCDIMITCKQWSECMPTGIRTRECYDFHDCNKNNKTILESEKCDYNATCNDNIKNQGEQEVDCGGPCGMCPTCSDKIKNQGEQEVDCGGPCRSCPTCLDEILNQDESDADCGGKCEPCIGDKKCNLHSDCESFVCLENICMFPTCSDSRKNQGETGIDCGGPCNPCATCNDKIKNQKEEEIDCGGPCKACVTCSDGKRNQGELWTDCGGPCNPCKLVVFIVGLKNYLLILIPILVLIVSYFIVKGMYSKDPTDFMLSLSKLISFLPKSISSDVHNIILDTLGKLEKVKQESFNLDDKQKIYTDYLAVINEFYAKIFEMDTAITSGSIEPIVRSRIINPFLANIFIELYYYALGISSDAPLFKIELNEKLDEISRILNMIRQKI